MKLAVKYALVILAVFGLAKFDFGQTQTIISTPGAGNFTVPCGVTSITIAVYGGGGGGGGSNSSTIGGGGGGAGGYAQAVFAVTPGQVIPYLVGSGGAGGGPANNGGFGSQTNVFGGTLFALGGTGGLCENLGGAGGAGGSASLWAINTPGANGTNGGTPQGGQGGGAGGPNGGGGGPGGGAGVNGGAGSSFGGGGGGGGMKLGGLNPSGGPGANGGIVFSYVLPYAAPNAGPDVSTCNVIYMQGNTPTAPWVGTWSIVSFSGAAPIIANPNDPNTLVTIPIPGSCATLQWTFTQPGCLSLSDQVTICYPLLCNDDPCGAIPLTVNPGACSYGTYSNNNATASNGMVEPGCGSYLDNDAWYSAVVPASGVISFQSTDFAGGTAMIMGMALYSEGPGGCNDIWHEGCDYATSSGDIAQLTYTGTPGETVYLRIWDYFENESNYSICAFSPSAVMGDIMPGANTIACGGPALTFYDPGGNGANYQNNTTAQYILCPDTPGQYITVDFTTGAFTFATEIGWDFLTILNGSTDSATVIGQYSGTEASGPGIVTSSATDGCLTIIFASDNLNTAAGWIASVDCSSTPGNNAVTCSGTDCLGECGTWICQSGLYPTENIGNNFEDLSDGGMGCFDNNGEIASQWFYFTALTSGTVELSFAGPGGQDYNFAIWGPNTNGQPPCPQLTNQAPLICSQADVGNYLTNGLTGLSSIYGNGQMYEGSEGDGWVDPLTIIAGETYAMVVNIYQNGGPQPIIDMTIGGTGTLDCTPVFLPVEIKSFTGIHQGSHNHLTWVASSQVNNDYFTIEKSVNGIEWEVLGTVDGAGTTAHAMYYELDDLTPYYPVTYYRLSQTDFNGTTRDHSDIAVTSQRSETSDFVSSLFPNPSSSYATFMYDGYDTKTPLEITLINELGEVIMSERYTTLYNGMPLTLYTSNLAGGLYQVLIQQGETRDVQRLTVIH
jgi:hypothetical protein